MTMLYYFVFHCHSNTLMSRIFLQVFMKHQTFLQEIEKNTENVPSLSPSSKRKLRISTKLKVMSAYRFLVWQPSEYYQEYLYISSEETKRFSRSREKYPRQTEKYFKMACRGGLAVKTFFTAVSTEVILKTSPQTLCKGLRV